ncbi:hypothetical protein [Natronomonas marina]|uniref:hypothetical protein n=1 Tax=Natronomonas marina TaxID=2961939 RepID=UPI0020C9CC4D|nr:hypothetical protein [Natronomonas marina]
MRIGITALGSLLGVVAVVALAPLVPVTVALAAGATATAIVVRRGRSGQYALGGSLFALGVAACVLYLPRFPGAWARTPLVALLAFGGLSATIVVLRWLLSFVGKRVVALFVDPDNAEGVWDALSAFGGLLVITWSVLTAHEKALRTGGITVVGGSTMLLDALGVRYPVAVPYLRRGIAFSVSGYEVVIPSWLVRNGVDAPTVLFVGCVLVGFHTLETLRATWSAVVSTGRTATGTSADAGAGPDPAGTDTAGGRESNPRPERTTDADAAGNDGRGSEDGDHED